ncbi:MAG: PEP-CTERM sorting domain-containing protein [Gammaproteobacteria bacterium]|nr:PEP-CTERM sorting domain-containing protein [Gammaproteobacteria bacterium]
MKNKKFLSIFTLGIFCSFTTNIQAYLTDTGDAAFNFWADQGWVTIGSDDGIKYGHGGQDFDTEYLFFKYDYGATDAFSDDTISIGLQTGFDVNTGYVRYGSQDYWGGDLALSFDNDVATSGGSTTMSNTYEYAVDFGLRTKDRYNNTVQSMTSGGSNGYDQAGLYKILTGTEANALNPVFSTGDHLLWDKDINYTSSNPFAMDEGQLLQALSFTKVESGSTLGTPGLNAFGKIGDGFYRTVTFQADKVLASAGAFTVDAHWTMSCGNDAINGSFDVAGYTPPGGGTPVPEPSVLALFSIGSLSMGFMGLRRRKISV